MVAIPHPPMEVVADILKEILATKRQGRTQQNIEFADFIRAVTTSEDMVFEMYRITCFPET